MFDSTTPHPRYSRDREGWHPSLVTLRDSVLEGCPFCMLVWKQLGINKMTIPQPSNIRFFQGFETESGDGVSSQVSEPHPKDVERPKELRVDFHVCEEPFES
jgi:hypothetical protein